MKFVSPKNDVAFKKIFGNEEKKEILISFLNAVLNLTGDKEIQHIEILNPWQAPRLENLKYTLLDVRAKDKRGISFIVEMQVEKVEGLRKRFVYYSAKTYSSQIERGADYPKLNQVIFIGILDFEEFEGDDYLTRHLIVNTSTNKQELTDLEFNFIELPKFKKSEQELKTVVDKWIYFIKHAENLDMIPPNTDTEEIRAAYELANRFGWSRDEMELYDYWDMKAQDERGMVSLALKKGRLEGKIEGKLEGKIEGEKNKALETARKMLEKNYPTAEISELTGLSVNEINELKDRLQHTA